LASNPFKDRLNVNREVQNAILKGTQESISKFVARVKTKDHVIAQPLSNLMPPEMLWSTTSSTVDASFKKAVVAKIGLDKALEKMSQFVPSATISKIVESSDMRAFAEQSGYDDVQSMLVHFITTTDKPSDEYMNLVKNV
jgi:hypothetical protein